jgi:hypothetical protein
MDIKERAREQLNWLERILHKLPGFKGYYERELRRDSDRLQREYILKQQRKVKSGMNKLIQAAARAKDFDLLREYDLFVREIDRSIGALRYADQGYSGFFDLVKIREPELDRVYEQDALAMDAAETLVAEFKKLSAAPLDPSGLVSLREALARIDDLFEKRTALLKGVDRGEGK